MRHRNLIPRTIGLWALLGLLAPSAALAGGGSGLDDQPVIRRQLMLRGDRHELTADLGATMADSFAHNWMLGVSYQYYFDNWIGAGLTLSGNMCTVMGGFCKTSLADDVETTNPHIGALDDVSRFGLMAMPYLSVVPISGKLGVFKKILHYDTHLIVGGALVTVSSIGGGSKLDDTIYGPMIGVGERIFISDSMAITITLRDLILSRVLNVSETGQKSDAQYENNFILSLGVNFYLPSEAKLSR